MEVLFYTNTNFNHPLLPSICSSSLVLLLMHNQRTYITKMEKTHREKKNKKKIEETSDSKLWTCHSIQYNDPHDFRFSFFFGGVIFVYMLLMVDVYTPLWMHLYVAYPMHFTSVSFSVSFFALYDTGSQRFLRHKSRCVSLTSFLFAQELTILCTYRNKHTKKEEEKLASSKRKRWTNGGTNSRTTTTKYFLAYYHALLSASSIDYIPDIFTRLILSLALYSALDVFGRCIFRFVGFFFRVEPLFFLFEVFCSILICVPLWALNFHLAI